MSIDKKIDDLIAALDANTAALEKVLLARTEVMSAAAKLADKTTAGNKDKADDDKGSSRSARGSSRGADKADDDKGSSRGADKADDDKGSSRSARGSSRGADKEDEDKGSARGGSSRGSDKADDAVTFDTLKAGYSKFLSVSDDDERADRAAQVKRICDKLDIARITDADERDYADLMDILADLKAGKKADLTIFGKSGKGGDDDLV